MPAPFDYICPAATLRFDLLTSKSNRFISILIHTELVNLVKFSQSVYKTPCSQTFGPHARTDGRTGGRAENIMPPAHNGGRHHTHMSLSSYAADYTCCCCCCCCHGLATNMCNFYAESLRTAVWNVVVNTEQRESKDRKFCDLFRATVRRRDVIGHVMPTPNKPHNGVASSQSTNYRNYAGRVRLTLTRAEPTERAWWN